MARKKKDAQPQQGPEAPEVPNARSHADITVENIDPAFVYEIDTDKKGTRGLGIVINLTHNPDTKEWIPNMHQRKRFFVFKPGAEYRPYTMPIDEAVGKNITQAYRKGPEEQKFLDHWIRENY